MASIRNNQLVGNNYGGQMYNFARQYTERAKAILETCEHDIYTDPRRVLMNPKGKEMLKEDFINNFFDAQEVTDASQRKELMEDMSLQFDNNVSGILEHTATGEMNPVIGMSTYMHKYIMMNMVFDKGAIQKVVTDSQKYTITQQYRYLVDTQGNKIDMFHEQNKMTQAINNSNPVKVFNVTLPELGQTDFVQLLEGTSEDHLSVITTIDSVLVKDAVFEIGDTLPNEDGYIVDGNPTATEQVTKDYWHYVNMVFTTTYASNDASRIAIKNISIPVKKLGDGGVVVEELKDTVSATVSDDKFTITATYGNVTQVRLKTRLDSSNGLTPTCYTKWEEKTIQEEIPDAIPMNTTITPDEIKDIGSLYKIDQTAELMDTMKIALLNYKDDTIKAYLDESFVKLPAGSKKYGQFDYAPREGYYASHVDWIRDTFFWYFDSFVTQLYQIYNDPNLTVSCFGAPDMVRKIVPTTVTYESQGAIGPVDLDFFKKTSTSDKRTYQWIGSDKMRGDDTFTILLNPTKDTRRITYRIVDYMMYIGNEIRNAKNSLIPSIHCYERFRVSEYNPVQGRIQILNPSGLREGDTDAKIDKIHA